MRMRTIKPGFFTDEDLAELTPLARLFYAGLWCAADREGRLEDRPRRLKAQILPYDAAEPEELLATLEAAGKLRRYTVQGARYIELVSFTRHQRPNVREAPSLIPGPGGAFDHIAGAAGMVASSARGRSGSGPGPDWDDPEHDPDRDELDPGAHAAPQEQEHVQEPEPEHGRETRLRAHVHELAIAGEAADAGALVVSVPQAGSVDAQPLPGREPLPMTPGNAAAIALAHRLKRSRELAGLPFTQPALAEVEELARLCARHGEGAVRQALDYSQSDEFWRPTIRSVGALCKRFDTIHGQSQRQPSSARGARARVADSDLEAFVAEELA